MRFHLGAVPATPDFSPDANWHPLREPSPWLMQLLALPIGISACVAVGVLWFLLTPLRNLPFDAPVSLLSSLLILIPIHELVHALAHPGSGRYTDTILGFWPSRLMFYAHYAGELSRARFIIILLTPLFAISFVPLIVCMVARQAAGLLAFCSGLNALCACGDMFGVALLLLQIPSDASVRNQGWRTYWRGHAAAAP